MTDCATKELTAGVIGLGVGERHLLGYAQIEGVTVKAICDIDPDKLDMVGDRLDIAERHTDARRLLEDPDIDVVSICSYDDVHAEQAEIAFKNGKHVMVEKPVALNRPDAERVLKAWSDSGRALTSNLILRQSPRFARIREMVQSGAFGDVFYVEGDYLHQILWKVLEGWRGKLDFYCVTYGGGIHLIDLIRWILDAEIGQVCGMANKVLTRDSGFAFPDTMTNLLHFDNDVLAKTTTTFGPQRPQLHRLNVFGSRLTFENDVPDGRLYHGDQPDEVEAIKDPYPGIEKFDLLPDFIDAIKQGREPDVSARDVFRVLDVCLACWESVEQRRTVDVAYMI